MGGFIATLIGVICKACVDTLAGGDTGGNAQFVTILFTGIAVILTIIGVLTTVIPAQPGKKKLIVLGIHGAIWVVGYFNPLGAIMGAVSGSSGQEEDVFQLQQPAEQPVEQEKVEVWRRTENGGREDLRVNSSGEMYYDPDDGEWHKIKK